jgi:hypothetical protein
MREQVSLLTPYTFGKAPTVRVPRSQLIDLVCTLRHYPTGFDLDQSSAALPDIWGSRADR